MIRRKKLRLDGVELEVTCSERKHLMGRLQVIVLAIDCLSIVSFLAMVGWNSHSMAVGLRQEQARLLRERNRRFNPTQPGASWPLERKRMASSFMLLFPQLQ